MSDQQALLLLNAALSLGPMLSWWGIHCSKRLASCLLMNECMSEEAIYAE